MDGTSVTVGGLLRQRRNWLGLTQAQVGAKSGFHHTVISRLESDSRSPTVEELERLSRALRCKPRDLVPDRHARKMQQS